MPDFLNQQINPPELWQEFEKLCADLWGHIWNDPNTAMHGRSGQAQRGVDVYGRKRGGDGDLVGVQCKGKDGRYGKAVTEKELKAEVDKAKTFKPPLKEFILATTAQNDAKIQEVAREITEKHKKEGLFRVEVVGWSEIHRHLADYPNLINKYYPGQGPRLHRVEEGVNTILERQLVAEERDDIHLRDIAKTTADETVEKFEALLISSGILPGSEDAFSSPAHEAVNAEIDGYRELLLKNQPSTALKLLEQLKERYWKKATDWTKFRILTNIASAHLSLGDKQIASKGFLGAQSYAPNDEKAVCNVALAHLLVGENAKAKNAALSAIDAFPDSDRAYSLLIAASIEDRQIEKPEDLVPEKQLETGEITYAISHFYRERGQQKDAAKWISRAYDLDKGHIEVRSSYAATLLESVVEEQSATIGEQRSQAQEEAIEVAADVLRGIWDEARTSEIASQYLQTAINLISTERLQGNYESALKVVDDALRAAPDSLDLKRQKAIILLEVDDPQGACEVLATVPEEENLEIAFLYAEALSQAGRVKDALEQLGPFLRAKTDYKELTIAEGLRLRLLLQVEGTKSAIEAIGEAVAHYPDAIIVRVNAATVFKKCGDSDAAREQVQRAKELITPETDYGEKLLVADAAYQMADYNEASILYKELVKSYRNSQPLRRLMICLYECDRRKEALDLLAKIPPGIRQLSFFRRMATAIYVRIGDLNAARSEIDEYLSLEPDDLHVRLNWIGILLRQGETDAVGRFLADSTDFPDASSEDRMHLSHLFDHFDHSEKAVDLAYRVRMENPGNPRVHLGYIGLLTMGKASSVLKEPNEVGVGTAFIVEDNKDRRYSYFILEYETNAPKEGEIKSDHPVALSAIGKKVGDTIIIQKNPYQVDKCRIIEIKSKYVHLLHITMSGFSDRFPTNQSFMPVSVENPEGEGYCFDPIFKWLSDRQNHVREVMAVYNSQPYPIGVVCRLLGTHPVDVWRGIQADRSVQIYCCDGTAPERRKAMTLVSEGNHGFVVDPLTLFNIHTLDVQEVVTATVGKLGLTQSGLDLLRSLIDDRRLQGGRNGCARMSKQNEQYVWHEITKDDIEADVHKLEQICDWASNNCTILPAVGTAESPLLARQFARLMDSAFTDCILAANGSGRALLSDDQRLRLYAKQFWNVEGAWLQSVLLVAVDRNLMPLDWYSDVTASLIEAGIHFTTINHNVLLKLAENGGWGATDRFNAVVATIGGEKADLKSSLLVAQNFLYNLWLEPLTIRQRENLTYSLISAITNNCCSPASHELLEALVLIGKRFFPTERKNYWLTIQGWCQGHFIPMPFT